MNSSGRGVSVPSFRACATALLLGCLTSNALAFEDGPINGRVTDAATHEPVMGAIVVARWDRIHESIGGSWETCNHVVAVATDAQGRFHIEQWSPGFYNPLDWLVGVKYWVTVAAYRAGMTVLIFALSDIDIHAGDIRLVKFAGTRSQRMSELSQASLLGCGDADHSLKILQPFHEAVYAEARSIATDSAQDRNTLWGMWRDLQHLEREGSIVTAPDLPASNAPIPKNNPAPVAPTQSFPQPLATHPQ